jgi:hypothetical protein
MGRQNGGRRRDPVLRAAEDPGAFAVHRGRLEAAIEPACAGELPWPGRIAAAIEAALAFAAADPIAARVLTVHSANCRLLGREPCDAVTGREPYNAMVDQLAARMARGAPLIPSPPKPERRTEVLISRLARQTLLHLELSPGVPATEIAPDLIVFVLTPYIGMSEARRWAEPG